MRVLMQGDTTTEIVSADRISKTNGVADDAAGAEENASSGSHVRDRDKSTMILESLPREPLRLRFRSRQTDTEDVFVSRAVLRSATGYATRMEQLLANVEGSPELRLGIPEGDYSISTEALVDGNITRVRRENNTLVIALPSDGKSHLVDLRVWLPMDASMMVDSIRPALDLPIGVGRLYWEIVAPNDSHVIWASPTLGRSMTWRFDRWRLYRASTQTSSSLAGWVGSTDLIEVPRGNRYLYVGSDVRSFRAIVVSRTILWGVTGSMVLLIAVLLSFVPQTRHPLFAVAAAVMFAGMLVVAPDAAVLAGQLGMIAMVLVVVMSAIRTMVQSRDHSSALDSRPRSRRIEGSTQMHKENSGASRGTLSATRSIAPASSVNKVTP
ncbi:putative membrane protein [Rhodopirellula maiorica SM1]|uniref:Putative membrane protein n=1 Tax=Rhodopirellula maiorica SM1 TaxID=1265738 RepID=M5RE37_9BACT|nr:putative membrane protein [Rhodopirellula maiorica SM1]